MSKQSFKDELKAYKQNGGQLSFAYGEVHIPVEYHELLGVIGVKMQQYNLFMPVDYQLDLFDNLSNLQDKLLEKYPQLLQ